MKRFLERSKKTEIMASETETWFANIKRTYDAYQDIDLERARRAQNDYDALREQSRRAVENAIQTTDQLNKILLNALAANFADINEERRQNRFNTNMTQAMANRIWSEVEIPEAEALAELIKSGKLGMVDLLQWLKTLIATLEKKIEKEE